MRLEHWNTDQGAALFVSTSLAFWGTERPDVFARDVQIDDTAFRRLDPEYFAWLRSRMLAARAAVDSGRVQADAFEELRRSFYKVQAWAIDAFGETTLREAMGKLNRGSYHPPLPEAEVSGNRQRRPAT